MTFRIDTDRIHLVVRQSIDSAVHAACARFADELGEEGRRAVHYVARAAAEAAIEQFAAYCNSELALIHADQKIQADRANLRGPSLLTLQTLDAINTRT